MQKHLNKTLRKLLVLVLLAFTTATVKGQQDIALTKETHAIPSEFDKNNDTLLILSSNPFYIMSMKKHFKRHYTGNYIFVHTINALNKYSVETSRYVLYEDINTTTKTKVGGPFNGQSRDVITHNSFRIEDRKTNINYINPNWFSTKMMENYLTALDDARKNSLP